MHRVARWIPLALLVSCGQTQDRPAQLGMGLYMPQIVLSRLDPQMHLRVFPRASAAGAYTCDTASGHVMRGGAHVADYGGGNVSPVVRCDSAMWNPMRQTIGEASPVDLCLSTAAPTTTVDVQAGNYIVLVEGSGASSTGTMRRIILGSGCAEINPTAGQTMNVRIDMQEQTDSGVCPDRDVAANESCDLGAEADTCDRCQFPERTVNTTQTVAVRNPSVAWAAGQRMVVGFESADDPYIHEFDDSGTPITAPAAYANDNVIGTLLRNEQHFIRLAAIATGYAAVWEDSSRNRDSFLDIVGTFSSYDAPPPPPTDALVNATSTAPMMDRRTPSVAINGSREVIVFADVATGGIRVAAATASMPFVAPAADTALVSSGGMGVMTATTPQIVSTSSGFAVAWTARDAGNLDIYAARLDMAGAAMGAPIRVNTETSGDQDQPSLASNGTDIVIAWRDASGADPVDNQGTTVRWRHFSAALAPDGNDRIAPTTVVGDQLSPAAAIAPNGVVLIAWEDASGQIRGRHFHADGTMVLNRISASAADFELDALPGSATVGMGPRHTPAASYGGTGLFGIVWQDAGLNRIRMRTLRADYP